MPLQPGRRILTANIGIWLDPTTSVGMVVNRNILKLPADKLIPTVQVLCIF